MNFFAPERLDKIRRMVNRGKPFVFDDGDMRTLHFDERVVQSAMRISDPDELVILYTRAMTGFRLFQPDPARIIIIGLGGGSIAKYCYRTFPKAHLTVLETNADVIALRSQFMLPDDDARFQVLHADASVFIPAQSDATADVILLDGFDAEGAPSALYTSSFFEQCWRVLSSCGVLVANMADEVPTIVGMVKEAQAMFGIRRSWWLKTLADNSHLLVAVKAALPHVSCPEDDARFLRMTQQMCEEQSLELVYPKAEALEIQDQDRI